MTINISFLRVGFEPTTNRIYSRTLCVCVGLPGLMDLSNEISIIKTKQKPDNFEVCRKISEVCRKKLCKRVYRKIT